MARKSRDTFDVTKRRDNVIAQTGTPVVDADRNEMYDILREHLRNAVENAFGNAAVGTSFNVVQSGTDTTNNFAFQPGPGFMLKGYQINITAGVEYKNQTITELASVTAIGADEITAVDKNWIVDELIGVEITFTSGVLNGNSYTVLSNTINVITLDTDVEALGALVEDRFEVGVHDLTTPISPRTDEVYLHLWEEEVSGYDDPTIVDPTIGIWLDDALCRRTQLRAVVQVAENGTTPSDTSTHFYILIATLDRIANDDIVTGEITDERPTVAGPISALVHNLLANLQGGSPAGGYYHMIDSQWDAIENAPTTPSASNPFTTVADVTGLVGNWRGSVQAATDLPSTGNTDKDIIFVEDDETMYWWNAEGVDQGSPYYKWYPISTVSTAWHDAQHSAIYNSALAITADQAGNTTIGTHMADKDAHQAGLQEILGVNGVSTGFKADITYSATGAPVIKGFHNPGSGTGIGLEGAAGLAADPGFGVKGISQAVNGAGIFGVGLAGNSDGGLFDGSAGSGIDVNLVNGTIGGAGTRPSYKGSAIALLSDVAPTIGEGDIFLFGKVFNSNWYSVSKTVAEMGTMEIVIPADTTLKGVKIEVCALCLLVSGQASSSILNITVDEAGVPGILATDEYTVTWHSTASGISASEDKRDQAKIMYYLTADGWDGTVVNKIQIGPYTASTTGMGNIMLAVSVLI